jgi:arabinan endo-1,5-alpha-L-arabinosidase
MCRDIAKDVGVCGRGLMLALVLCCARDGYIAAHAADEPGKSPAAQGTPSPLTPQEWQRLFLQPEGPTKTPRIHDPVIAKEGGAFYIFSTGPGIKVHRSSDMVTWERQGRVFEKPPSWTAETIPGSRDYYWAPDIAYFGGKWHLYYSVSTFGKNRSAIGLATNVTLDPTRRDFEWKNEGVVIESHLGDNWNAIDSHVLVEDERQAWLSLGSYWSGIKLIALDPATGKPSADARLLSLASRPHTPEIRGAVEAPFIVRRGEYYYLFVSFDQCCRGAASTYNIRVGRASAVTGPYADREGTPMLEGGGTMVRAGDGRWRGPGHNAVFRHGDADWLVYHAYDAQDRGIAKLRIEKLNWDEDGWPEAVARGDSE